MSLGAPAGLLLLLLLPVLWWIHRRATRRSAVEIPSLLFLREELDAPPARRLHIDPELLLGLAAMTALALAAAGPSWQIRPARRTVTLVTSGGAPSTQRTWDERVKEAESRVRELVPDDLDLRVLQVPRDDRAPRPPSAALLATAHVVGGTAGLVLSDAPAPADDDVWWTWGRPEASNVGLAAMSITPDPVGLRVFALLVHSGRAPTSCSLLLEAPGAPLRRAPVTLEPDGLVSVEIGAAPAPDTFTVRLAAADGGAWQDDLAADDAVVFRREPLRVYLSPALPREVVRAFDAARAASVGEVTSVAEGEAADLRVVVAGEERGDGLHLVLHPLPEGATGTRAPPGRDLRFGDDLVRDLDSRTTDLVFAPSALGPEGEVLLARMGSPHVPVVTRMGNLVHFLPDPTAGDPAPIRTPLWPLFIENVLRRAGGGGEEAGYRREGLLDLASSRLGRTLAEAPILARLPSLPPDRAAVPRSLRPWLLGLVLLLLAWLYWRF